MAPKKSYDVDEAVHGQIATRFGERFAFDFPKGAHAAKSEAEEDALEHLVSIGMATAPDGRRWKSPIEEAPAPEPEEAPEASDEEA